MPVPCSQCGRDLPESGICSFCAPPAAQYEAGRERMVLSGQAPAASPEADERIAAYALAASQAGDEKKPLTCAICGGPLGNCLCSYRIAQKSGSNRGLLIIIGLIALGVFAFTGLCAFYLRPVSDEDRRSAAIITTKSHVQDDAGENKYDAFKESEGVFLVTVEAPDASLSCFRWVDGQPGVTEAACGESDGIPDDLETAAVPISSPSPTPARTPTGRSPTGRTPTPGPASPTARRT